MGSDFSYSDMGTSGNSVYDSIQTALREEKITMKHEWRKKEKRIYIPKNTPEYITIPSFKFFMIEGKGNVFR